jgi:hypothetical protein
LVKEWEGKEILFPESMVFTQSGIDTLDDHRSEPDYTIVSYIDSVGCTSCKLKFHRWLEIMHEMDSISGQPVPFLFIFHPKSKRDLSELSYLMKRDNFSYPVWIDVEDTFNGMNKLPDNSVFHSFLIDKQNKMVAMGNPFENPKIKELYLNVLIGGESEQRQSGSDLTDISINQSVVDFGEFDWKASKEAIFRLNNKGKNRLVINDVVSSCGCISVVFPKAPVCPSNDLVITATYRAEKPEYFSKVLTVHANTKTPLRLTIRGSAH